MSDVEPIVFLNDRFVPASKASLNIFDLGIVLGATLTEMTRTFRHQPFRLDDHIARLYRSLKYSSIELSFGPERMREITMELIAHNAQLAGPGAELGVVHFVTPGENRIYAGSAASARTTPTVCVHSFPLPLHLWKHLIIDGAHVVTPWIRHVPPQCVDPKMKNRSRLHWWLADQQTRQVDPKAITLLLDLEGNVTECAGSNFVILRGKTVVSPPVRNILQGVSLLTVRDICSELGLSWTEEDIVPYDVINADEAWLTTTPYCIAAATKINGSPIGQGKPGPWCAKVMDAWSARVGVDIRAQIEGATA